VIIARSQCWLCPSGKISVFALKYPYLPSYIRIFPRIQLPVYGQWSQRLYVKVQGKMVQRYVYLYEYVEDTNTGFNSTGLKSYFNQIHTFQNVGKKFE
jgi:hypothetical protein